MRECPASRSSSCRGSTSPAWNQRKLDEELPKADVLFDARASASCWQRLDATYWRSWCNFMQLHSCLWLDYRPVPCLHPGMDDMSIMFLLTSIVLSLVAFLSFYLLLRW